MVGETSLSAKGNDKANDVVLFEELESGTGIQPTKKEQLLALLSEKLTPEDLGSVRELLGLPTELSNAELFEKIKAELFEKKPKDEEEDPAKKNQAPDYKEFVKSCMEEGKDLKTCAAEYKEKHGDATDAEIADVEKLAKAEDWGKKKKDEEEDEYPPAVKKKLEELDAEIKSLKELRRTEGIDSKVDAMVSEDHMTPVQATGIKKLMRGLPDADQNAILDVFRTQKISARNDIGGQALPGTEPMTSEHRERIMQEHGLDRLLEAKGGRLPGVE